MRRTDHGTQRTNRPATPDSHQGRIFGGMNMTIEEAIEILERKTTIPDTNYTWAQIDQAIDTAIIALRSVSREQELEAENKELKERIVNWRKYMASTREQVEKVWKGCSWCNNEGRNSENWECSLLDDRGLSVVVGDEVVWTNANFCPVCGKPLTDETMQMVIKRLEVLKNM